MHPKTGKVCVPLDPATVDGFDPTDGVPTVAGLLAQLPPGAAGGAQVRARLHDAARGVAGSCAADASNLVLGMLFESS